MVISTFISSVSGMDAQSHAMGQVSTNIANMTTIGYKPTETMFYSMLGSQPAVKGGSSEMLSNVSSDITGVGYYDRTNVELQGDVTYTGGNYDVAINGTGNAFFVVKDAYGQDMFTRAGNFTTRVENEQSYLIANNGAKVQGYPYLGEAGFSASYEDIVFNPLDIMPPVPTSQLSMTANVPASGVETSSYGMTIYGPNNDGQTVNMLFSKVEGQLNTWEVTFSTAEGDVVSAPQTVTFKDNGIDPTPASVNLSINWNENAGGGSNNVNVDISTMTQYAMSSGIANTTQDGNPSGYLHSTYIDEHGVLQASYSNQITRPIAQLALVSFQSPSNLISEDGTMFSASPQAGEMYALDTNKYQSYITPSSLEQAAVQVEEEFSRLVVVQQAYSMNTQSFTVGNEMLQQVIDLKS